MGLDAKSFRISSTGWQGTNYNATKEGSKLVREWGNGAIASKLVDFVRIHYRG
jgi:hypothetical protein